MKRFIFIGACSVITLFILSASYAAGLIGANGMNSGDFMECEGKKISVLNFLP